jgi:hypothetical protein
VAVGGWGESQGSISPALFALKSAMCGFLCTSNHGTELLHGTIVGYERGERGEGGKVGGESGFLTRPPRPRHAVVGRVKGRVYGKGRVPQGPKQSLGGLGRSTCTGGARGVLP